MPIGSYWVRERLSAKSRKFYLIDDKITISAGNYSFDLVNEFIEIKPIK